MMQRWMRDGYRRVVLSLIGVVSLCVCVPAPSQILRGPWVDEAEQAIDKHRKSELVVIVLDRQDRAVHGASVRITQTRHAFPLGLTIPADREPPESAADLPLLRCFNALALDRLTRWDSVDPRWPDDIRLHYREWDEAIKPIETAFGPVVSGDPAYNSNAFNRTEPNVKLELLDQRVKSVFDLGPPVNQIDLFADAEQDFGLRDELGFGAIARMFETARAASPDASLNLRFRDALNTLASRELASAVQMYELRQTVFDGITIDQHFNEQIQPLALRRTLADRIGTLGTPLTIANLGVSGTSPMSAMLNLETVVRLLFAEPSIRAIYFEGLTVDDVVEPAAALIDEHGELTPAGQLIDDLFRKHWWSQSQGTTDERGNVRSRVFNGWYDIEVTLPGGKALMTQAYVDPQDGETRYVVMQETAGD